MTKPRGKIVIAYESGRENQKDNLEAKLVKAGYEVTSWDLATLYNDTKLGKLTYDFHADLESANPDLVIAMTMDEHLIDRYSLANELIRDISYQNQSGNPMSVMFYDFNPTGAIDFVKYTLAEMPEKFHMDKKRVNYVQAEKPKDLLSAVKGLIKKKQKMYIQASWHLDDVFEKRYHHSAKVEDIKFRAEGAYNTIEVVFNENEKVTLNYHRLRGRPAQIDYGYVEHLEKPIGSHQMMNVEPADLERITAGLKDSKLYGFMLKFNNPLEVGIWFDFDEEAGHKELRFKMPRNFKYQNFSSIVYKKGDKETIFN